ncbi:MAG TPA: DUF4142 domain-containing protein [Longimicrobiales bacterium]|nr:DUF4142 domain-containing protein [Longimicrobiales bacterium]
MNVRIQSSLLAAVATLAIAACAEPITVGVPAPRPVRAADAEVVSVMHTANEGEIMTSQTALQRASSSAVRQFAQRMITDHTALNERLSLLPIVPGPSNVANQLDATARETVEVLQRLDGHAFDVAYMNSQVDLHQYTLGALDGYLIPSVSDPALRGELEAARVIIAEHLARAREIRDSL